jgi:hypothetical protein
MRVLTRSMFAAVVLGTAAVGLSAANDFTAQPASAQVVVRAVARDGQPVLDLKAGDVSVRVDGTEREVKSLELMRPPESTAAAAAPVASTPPPSPLAPPYATNAAPEAAAPGGGREVILLVDDEGIGPGREEQVRQAIAALVGGLTAADRVGLTAMKQGGVHVPPSPQHRAVLDALPRIVATGSPSETPINLACRTKVMLGTIGGLLRGAPAQRTIVLFSPGMAPISADAMRGSGRFDNNPTDTGLCQIRSNDLEELSRMAATSPAEFFVVYHSEGMANAANLSNAQAGLENVAGTTGGEMVRLTGTGEAAGTRIARASGFYYVATLEGAAGSARRVDARVNRDGVRVTARPLSVAPAAATTKGGTPRDMIRVATVFRDVAIRAAGFVSRQQGANEPKAAAQGANDLKVVVLFEPEDPAVKLTAAMVGLFDEKGTLKAQWTAQPNELARSPVVAALTAAPGRYRMRVAASDSSARGGTTDYDLTVQLPEAAPVKTSHMLLGVGQGGFAPKLAFTSADAAAIGFIEIYDVAKNAKVEATFEIVKADGEVMGSGQGTVGAGPGEDARIAYGGFGVATLEPGDYTMRATINVDGKQAGVATRTLRKLK